MENNIKEIYGKNLNLMQSPYDPTQWKLKDLLPMKAYKIPDNYISEGVYDFGYDQKDSSQCAASAYSFIRLLQERDKEQSEITEHFSPTWSYGKRVEDAYCGEGMYLCDVVRGGREFGSVMFNELPYPCSYIKAKAQASGKFSSLIEKAKPFVISSYYTCNSRKEIQIAIMETKAVLIGVPCFDTIFSPDENGKVRYIKGQENAGGHAIVLVGWMTDEEGFWWIVKNSWGKYTKHGDGSTFLLHETYPWMDTAYAVIDDIQEVKFKEYKEKYCKKEEGRKLPWFRKVYKGR